MRGPVAFAILGVALVSVGASLGGAQTGSALHITYWQDGAKAGASTTWTLRCGPPRGTLPQAARACRRLASGGPKLFAPTSENAVCTEIYGGAQKARVVGTVGATRVWAMFSRTNGCEIARWNRISPWLVPSGGAT